MENGGSVEKQQVKPGKSDEDEVVVDKGQGENDIVYKSVSESVKES